MVSNLMSLSPFNPAHIEQLATFLPDLVVIWGPSDYRIINDLVSDWHSVPRLSLDRMSTESSYEFCPVSVMPVRRLFVSLMNKAVAKQIRVDKASVHRIIRKTYVETILGYQTRRTLKREACSGLIEELTVRILHQFDVNTSPVLISFDTDGKFAGPISGEQFASNLGIEWDHRRRVRDRLALTSNSKARLK